MKKLLILLLLQSLFISATPFENYIKKDYKKARQQLIEEVVNTGGDPLNFYNLGVTVQQQKKYGEAIYYYLQSLQYAPDFSEAHNNLDQLVKQQNIKVPKRLLDTESTFIYTLILFFLFLYIFVFMLILYMFRPDWKLRIALIPVFMLLLLSTFAFFNRYQNVQEENFSVAVKKADLKSGPDEALTTVGSVKEGEVLEILTVSGDWAKARSFQDNIEGWVHVAYIKHIIRRIN